MVCFDFLNAQGDLVMKWIGRTVLTLTALPLPVDAKEPATRISGNARTSGFGKFALFAAAIMACGSVWAQADKKAAPSLPPEQAQLIQAWARSLAVQAATYGSAIVAMYNLRDTVAVGPKAKAPPGTIWKFTEIASPKIAQETGYRSPTA